VGLYFVSIKWIGVKKNFNFQLSMVGEVSPKTRNLIFFLSEPMIPSWKPYLALFKYLIMLSFFWDLNIGVRFHGQFHLNESLWSDINSDIIVSEIQWFSWWLYWPEYLVNSHFICDIRLLSKWALILEHTN
jgi:hypothetical protein